MVKKSLSCECITIGREILDGRILDRNTRFFGGALKKRGLRLNFAQSCDDEVSNIIHCFEIAQKRSEYIFVTGGLGPTDDDRTLSAFAQYLGIPLEFNTKAYENLCTVLKSHNREVQESQKKQALLPQDAHVLWNQKGTASGVYSHQKESHWFFFPGIPRELHQIFNDEALRFLPQSNLKSRTWTTLFTSEGSLQEELKDFSKQDAWEIGYQTHFPYNYVTLYEKEEQTDDAFQKQSALLNEKLASYCFSEQETPAVLEEHLIQKLAEENCIVASVESCTGGLIAEKLCSVPGASQAFVASWVCYDNQAKIDLGLDPEILKKFGAVSTETAHSLASAALDKLAQMFPHKKIKVLVTTGIAGPKGGSPEKPVGTCFIATGSLDPQNPKVEIDVNQPKIRSTFDRNQQRNYFTYCALKKLL